MKTLNLIALMVFGLVGVVHGQESLKTFVSSLRGASALSGGELFYCVQSDTSSSCTPTMLATFIDEHGAVNLDSYGTPHLAHGVAVEAGVLSNSDYPVSFISYGDVGSLTSIGGSGAYSFTPFLAKNGNSAGWSSIILANDQYVYNSAGDVTTGPTSQYCCSNTAAGQLGIMFFGSTVMNGGIITSQPNGSSGWMGTINDDPFCLGTYQHCILLFSGQYGQMSYNPGGGFPTGDGFDITANPGGASGAGQYIMHITSGGVTGNANGLKITAGTSSEVDFALYIENTSGTRLFTVDGVGNVGLKAPTNMSAYSPNAGVIGGDDLESDTDFSDGIEYFGTQVAKSGPISCVTFNGGSVFTSSTTTFSVTGLPNGTTGSGAGLIVLEDNGVVALGSWQKSGTTITFSNGVSPGVDFTASGNKGIPNQATICWNDN